MPKYLDVRRKALRKRFIHGFKLSRGPKIDIEKLERVPDIARKHARALVRQKIREVSLAYVDNSEPLGILENSKMKGFILKRSLDALESSCDFCKDLKNAEVVDGVYARLLCASCCMRLAEKSKCPGVSPTCEKTLWINELGLQSALCRECDRCEQIVASVI